MTFSDLYGTDLDTELGSTDRTQRFTTALRQRYANEGQRVFNEQTSCFVREAPIPLVDGTQEYDLESVSVTYDIGGGSFFGPTALSDYLWPSKTGATLRRYDGSGTANTDYAYTEGPDLLYTTEEELDQTEPNWRAVSAGVPTKYYLRADGGRTLLGLHPTPDVPSAETWTLLFPYVAQPADMSGDSSEPFTANGNIRTVLRPYHRALVHYAAAQCEKLRKDWEAVERQMKLFAAYVAKYVADQAPQRGTSIRLRQDYRARLRTSRPVDPTRYP